MAEPAAGPGRSVYILARGSIPYRIDLAPAADAREAAWWAREGDREWRPIGELGADPLSCAGMLRDG